MPITRVRTKSRVHLADSASTSRREIAISYVYTRTVEHRIHISRAEVAMRPCGEIYGLYPHRCGDLCGAAQIAILSAMYRYDIYKLL